MYLSVCLYSGIFQELRVQFTKSFVHVSCVLDSILLGLPLAIRYVALDDIMTDNNRPCGQR